MPRSHRWLPPLSLSVLLIALTLLLLPRTGVHEMVAGETSSEYRAIDRRMEQLEEALERQGRTIEGLREENERLRRAQDRLARAKDVPVVEPESGYALRLHPVPERVEFLGEALPLERPDVHRRFEEEWLRYLVNRHWVIKWHRRSRDVFDAIEARLAAAGLPEDLKYVMVIESGVEARATSSAGAVGWWQFMRGTGKDYGLERATHLDERRELDLATDAAIAYLRDLYAEFGSWPLALSAYNAGERRVREFMEEQGATSFYDMVLPRETEAYWFKAAAAKAILSDPERFRLELDDDGWAPVACDTLRVRVTRDRVALRSFLVPAGVTYRELKELNPGLRRSWLPYGTHRLIVPADRSDAVVAGLDGMKLLGRTGVPEPMIAGETKESPATEVGDGAAPPARAAQEP